MKLDTFKKVNENYLAVLLTFVLFFLLFLLKVQEGKNTIESGILNSSIELAKSDSNEATYFSNEIVTSINAIDK